MKKVSLNQVLLEYAAKSLSNLKIPQLGNCKDSRLNEDTLDYSLRPTFRTLASQLSWVAKLTRKVEQVSNGRVWLKLGDPTDYITDCKADTRLIKEIRWATPILYLEATDGKKILKFVIMPMHAIAPGFGPFMNEELQEPVG